MPLNVDDLIALVTNTPSASQFGSLEEITAAADFHGIGDPAAFLQQAGVELPVAPGVTTSGDPLNVVQGGDFLADALEAYLGILGVGATAQSGRESRGLQERLGMAGIGESAADRGERARQFDITSSLQRAAQMAQLRGNPLSAAESAFMRAGLGLDPFSGGGTALDLASIIAPATRGAGGTSSVDIGGNTATTPNTLGGRQLAQTAGSPAAGVIESLAAAAGNPGMRARSIAAAIPTGFPG